MLEKERRLKGCETILDAAVHRIGKDLSFRTCIGNFVDKSVYSYLDAHRKYEAGILPYPGALMDQPAKILEVFQVIDAHKQDKMRAEAEKSRAVKPNTRPTRGR